MSRRKKLDLSLVHELIRGAQKDMRVVLGPRVAFGGPRLSDEVAGSMIIHMRAIVFLNIIFAELAGGEELRDIKSLMMVYAVREMATGGIKIDDSLALIGGYFDSMREGDFEKLQKHKGGKVRPIIKLYLSAYPELMYQMHLEEIQEFNEKHIDFDGFACLLGTLCKVYTARCRRYLWIKRVFGIG